MLLAAVNLAGRDGKGGGADAELVVVAGAVEVTVMVAGAELIVGAGVSVTGASNKGAAEVAALLWFSYLLETKIKPSPTRWQNNASRYSEGEGKVVVCR